MDNRDYLEFLDSGEVAEAEPIPDPWIKIRGDRNALLSATDWSQLMDVPTATQQLYAAYRQTLRDVPQSYKGTPTTVVFPNKPE